MVRSASSGLKVAARLSPPDSTKHSSACGNFKFISSIAARFMDASSRIAVCRQRLRAGQDELIFLCVDVVGNYIDVVEIPEMLAQRLYERRLTRANRAPD